VDSSVRICSVHGVALGYGVVCRTWLFGLVGEGVKW
jgi:hypothetical protein